MPSLLQLHRLKLGAVLLAANFALLLYLAIGDLKPFASWAWTDIVGEGGSALLALLWIGLVLRSRPAGRVTQYLVLGLGLVFFSWWVDCLDEFIALPEHAMWDHWLESASMPLGLLLLTVGIYHWHREQLAISAQMEKRERLFREHRLFDAVTPLSGADYLRIQLEHALQQARSGQKPLALVMLDLDAFNAINREHGHAEGDRVLQALTQLLLLNLRRQDLLCRLAGDRFVILLPDTGAALARELAQELEAAVRHFAYRDHCGERIALHASTAVATATSSSEDPLQLLERLHLALARNRQPPYAHSA